MGIFGNLFGKGPDFGEMLDNGAAIIDVRSPQEFRGGHIKGAVNIPVDQIGSKLSKIRKMGEPVILCCASGMRSGRATSILKREGIEAYNGGSWSGLQRKVS